jgi:hypothetical protein
MPKRSLRLRYVIITAALALLKLWRATAPQPLNTSDRQSQLEPKYAQHNQDAKVRVAAGREDHDDQELDSGLHIPSGRIAVLLPILGVVLLGVTRASLWGFYANFDVSVDEVGFSTWDMTLMPALVVAWLSGVTFFGLAVAGFGLLLLPAPIPKSINQQTLSVERIAHRRIRSAGGYALVVLSPSLLIAGMFILPLIWSGWLLVIACIIGACVWVYFIASLREDSLRESFRLLPVQHPINRVTKADARQLAAGSAAYAAVGGFTLALVTVIIVGFGLPLPNFGARETVRPSAQEDSASLIIDSFLSDYAVGLQYLYGQTVTAVCVHPSRTGDEGVLSGAIAGLPDQADGTAPDSGAGLPDEADGTAPDSGEPALLLGRPGATTILVDVSPAEGTARTVVRVPTDSVIVRHAMHRRIPDCWALLTDDDAS